MEKDSGTEMHHESFGWKAHVICFHDNADGTGTRKLATYYENYDGTGAHSIGIPGGLYASYMELNLYHYKSEQDSLPPHVTLVQD